MHEWRKLYGKKLSNSERVASISFEARWLYVLLLGLQDDHGQYPWTPVMIRSLCATTDWNTKRATELLKEIEKAGLGETKETMFVLRNGQSLNGVPTSGKYAGRANLYPVNEERTSRVVQEKVRSTPRIEEKRIEEKRIEEEKSVPDFLETLREIPEWSKVTADKEQELINWLLRKEVSDNYAEREALSLREKWWTKRKYEYANPLLTFKKWVLRPDIGVNHGQPTTNWRGDPFLGDKRNINRIQGFDNSADKYRIAQQSDTPPRKPTTAE
tara:strand:- start:415 stop:1227 length:813 start_codon:yes stop_codon:yes gene_type:complete